MWLKCGIVRRIVCKNKKKTQKKQRKNNCGLHRWLKTKLEAQKIQTKQIMCV